MTSPIRPLAVIERDFMRYTERKTTALKMREIDLAMRCDIRIENVLMEALNAYHQLGDWTGCHCKSNRTRQNASHAAAHYSAPATPSSTTYS